MFLDGLARSPDLRRLRRRFLKDAKHEDFYARQAIKMKHQQEILKQERRLAREAQVTMYRNYRSGDLPDIQINRAAIIAPLQALAQVSEF